MNKEKLRLWIDALRSGEYEQGRGGLARRFDPNGSWQYCCLGVACEVAIKDGLDLAVSEGYGGSKPYGAAKETGFLPDEVVQWLGVDEANPVVLSDDPASQDGFQYVAFLNDTCRWDYGMIAEALEKTYLNMEDGK